MKKLAWYLCTIASTSKVNWGLCKTSKTWGILTTGDYSSHDRARKGDNLLFWLAGRGYVGYASVTEDTRAPQEDSEVPWQGGQERYGLVIPLSDIIEFSSPVLLKFVNRKQAVTGLDQSMFQRGYMPITDSAASSVKEIFANEQNKISN